LKEEDLMTTADEVPVVPDDQPVEDETERLPVDTDLNEPDELEEGEG
jgi:hypothetical protein